MVNLLSLILNKLNLKLNSLTLHFVIFRNAKFKILTLPVYQPFVNQAVK